MEANAYARINCRGAKLLHNKTDSCNIIRLLLILQNLATRTKKWTHNSRNP